MNRRRLDVPSNKRPSNPRPGDSRSGDSAPDDDDSVHGSRRSHPDRDWQIDTTGLGDDVLIVPRPDHCISRSDIDADALKVLYRLHRNGFRGFLVGGGVRDLLLGRRPKDFDIATDAKPRRLKKMFRNCRIIGRRFRLAHLHYPGDKIIEVATFRSSPENDAIVRDGDLIQRDNVFGTPEEDAKRRDLTINGLFYSIADFSVIDYVGGVADLRGGIVRMIRDPVQSFREDPVRMLRAIRHATRLDFDIEEETHCALISERNEILKANSARLLEEMYKDLSSGSALQHFQTLHEYRFLQILIPQLAASFKKRGKRAGKALLFECLERLDELQANDVEITHAMGLAALFAPLILPVARALEDGSARRTATPYEPFQDVLLPAFDKLKIYRRDGERLWHILGAWPRIARARERMSIPMSLARRHYFPEAAEVYGLVEEESPELTEFLLLAREHFGEAEDPEPEPPRRRSSRRRGPRREGDPSHREHGGGGKTRRRRRRKKTD